MMTSPHEPATGGHRRSHACSHLSATEQVACVRAVERGELAALGRLYALFAPGLTRSAHEVLDEPSDAPDLVHDVFLRLCDRADQFDPDRGSVWRWLNAITRHACLDHNRRGRVLSRVRHRMRAGGPTMTEEPLDELALLTLRRRLSSLPPEHRRTVEAAFWEDASYVDIAARERVPLNTVKSRGARAMHALRSDFGAVESRASST